MHQHWHIWYKRHHPCYTETNAMRLNHIHAQTERGRERVCRHFLMVFLMCVTTRTLNGLLSAIWGFSRCWQMLTIKLKKRVRFPEGSWGRVFFVRKLNAEIIHILFCNQNHRFMLALLLLLQLHHTISQCFQFAKCQWLLLIIRICS